MIRIVKWRCIAAAKDSARLARFIGDGSRTLARLLAPNFQQGIPTLSPVRACSRVTGSTFLPSNADPLFRHRLGYGRNGCLLRELKDDALDYFSWGADVS